MMKGREIKGTGQSGYTKGTKMFRTRHYIVLGGLAYTIIATLAFYKLDASHKLAGGVKDLDVYLKNEREEKFKEMLAKRVARAEKFSVEHERKAI